MRKWHRWLSFIFGAVLLFVAVTGVLSHFAAMYARGAIFETEQTEARSASREIASAPAAAASGANDAAPAKNPKRKIVGLLHHLHSGEFFGPAGVIVSLLSGLAMIFFAFSGLWLYFQMYVRRRKLGAPDPFWN